MVRLRNIIHKVGFVQLFMLAALTSAAAVELRKIEPREFDFYVLALSWSPSYCISAQERTPNLALSDGQCAGRSYSFIVHGLWPQNERGFPSFCQVPAPPLDNTIINSMLDLMPSRHLIFYEWKRHGTCSGLSAQAYFETIRKARGIVKIPTSYTALKDSVTVSPSEIANAFVKINPKLSPDAFAIVCDNKRLREIRLCFTKDFSFRACPQIVHHSCRRNEIEIPAIRSHFNYQR
jgi:ribonuclease T2